MNGRASISYTTPGQLVGSEARSGIAPRSSLWIGMGVWLVSVLVSAAGIVLFILNQATIQAHPEIQLYPAWLTTGLPYIILGGLIIVRQPANRIGWLLTASGLSGVISFTAQQYAIYALATAPEGQPLAPEAAWLAGWLWILLVALYPLFILLYPDGKPPSQRWRWAVWLDLAIPVILCLPTMIGSWSVRSEYIFDERVIPSWVLDSFDATFSPLLLVGALISLIALIVRYRAAGSVERAQIRWVIYAVALYISISLITETLLENTPLGLAPTVLLSTTTLTFLILPVCIGVAIFRYHLFDIDRLINRTLVYAPLTGILAGVYAGSMTIFQGIFQAITGETSDAAIVLSTLVLTALFTPVQNFIQAFVDKRWKEPSGSLKKLRAFGTQVQDSISPVDPGRVLRRFLEEAALAIGARSGAAYVQRNEHMEIIETYGDWQEVEDNASLAVSFESQGKQLGMIKLCQLRWEGGYSNRERKALQATADMVADAMDMAV